MSPPAPTKLTALTYLAPGIPLSFFQHLTRYLERSLGVEVRLRSETENSGPMQGDPDPFASGEADVGFVCSPSYLHLAGLNPPTVKLLPVGFVFDDPRTQGRPEYYSDLVVRFEREAHSLEDLRGLVFGYNDVCSLSGYFSTLQRLAELGHERGFFAQAVRTGSHSASVEALRKGTIDVATLDSNVLRHMQLGKPKLVEQLRVVESFGPFPIQPVVTRASLEPGLHDKLTEALLAVCGERKAARWLLKTFGLSACVPIDEQHYAEERRALVALGKLHTTGAQEGCAPVR